MFGLVQKKPLEKSFNVGWWDFSHRTFTLRENIAIFRNFNHNQSSREENKKFQTIAYINCFPISLQLRSTSGPKADLSDTYSMFACLLEILKILLRSVSQIIIKPVDCMTVETYNFQNTESLEQVNQ